MPTDNNDLTTLFSELASADEVYRVASRRFLKAVTNLTSEMAMSGAGFELHQAWIERKRAHQAYMSVFIRWIQVRHTGVIPARRQVQMIPNA